MEHGKTKHEVEGLLTVEAFARAVGISERSAWNVFKAESERAKSTGQPNRLPLVTLIRGSRLRRVRVTDVNAWIKALAE